MSAKQILERDRQIIPELHQEIGRTTSSPFTCRVMQNLTHSYPAIQPSQIPVMGVSSDAKARD